MKKQSFMIRAMLMMGVGILPLILGLFISWVIQTVPSVLSFATLLSFFLLLVWGCCSFILSTSSKNFLLQAFLMCAFGLLMLILDLYQELVKGAYWSNVIGAGSQLFFLPWVPLATWIIRPFNFFRMWLVYSVSWIGLFLVSCVGCFTNQHKQLSVY